MDFIFALMTGLLLGLIGSGGSVLTVPTLVYAFHLDEKIATAYSLFIVGGTALVGGIRQHKSNNVDWRTALVFGIPSIMSVWSVRHFVVSRLPEVLFSFGSFEFTRRMAMLGTFSVLMIFGAYSMLFGKIKPGYDKVKYNYLFILVEGLIVGAITGFVGVGGGFLIIPALVILAQLEMKKAIGTSLVIIAIKSLIGFFLGDVISTEIDWKFLFLFTSIAVVGIFIGEYIGRYIEEEKLKKTFALFIITMAIYIFFNEFIINSET